jgi:lysine/ornithine N-monooxygenase
VSTEGFNLENDHIPGEHVNEYFHDYVNEFGLTKYIRFNINVKSAVDNGHGGWTLTVIQPGEGVNDWEHQIASAKLVVATGLTSEPFMPELHVEEAFNAPIYHSSEFAAEDGVGRFKNVTLLNGAKFSWDIAYAYASAGVQVDWIIRKSGHGPCWMMPNRMTPLKVIPELLLQTRLMA